MFARFTELSVQPAGRAAARDATDFDCEDAGGQGAQSSGSLRGSGSLRKRAAASGTVTDTPEGEVKKQKPSGGRGKKQESKETGGLSAKAVEAVEDASAQQRCCSCALRALSLPMPALCLLATFFDRFPYRAIALP